MAIEIRYHSKRNKMYPDFLRTEEVVKGETFSNILEQLCENWVIEPQFGILTEMGSFATAIPRLYSLIYCALVPHPFMLINFADEKEVRTFFDNLFKPITVEGDWGDSHYQPMIRIDRRSQTQNLPIFLVNALYYVSEKNIDEVKRSFERNNNCSKSCESRWYVFD